MANALSHPHEPLGFSDLLPDEELMIIAYREWRRRGAGPVVEHSIARSLRKHAAYGALDAAFDAFAEATDKVSNWYDPGIVMTTEEERVLTLLANRMTSVTVPLDIREAHAIGRTGRDRRLMHVNDSYHAMAALYGLAAPRRLH